MKIVDYLSTVPEKTYIVIFVGIMLLASAAGYFLKEDTRLVEQRIASKQKELSNLLRLRDTYDMKRKASEKNTFTNGQSKGISLASVEEMVSKTFVGGKLSMLKPATLKEETGKKALSAVEVKINGAALGEVLSFVKTAEASGFYVRKLQLMVPAANQTALDVQATIVEG